MLFLETALKILKENFRHKGRLAVLILFPILLFSFFGFVFNTDPVADYVLRVGIIDSDTGSNEDYMSIIPSNYNVGTTQSLGQLYGTLLTDYTNKLLETQYKIEAEMFTSQSDMEREIQTQNLHIGIVIPQNFTAAIVSGYARVKNSTILSQVPINATVITIGDPSTGRYQIAEPLIQQSLSEFTLQFYGIEVYLGFPPTGGYMEFKETEVIANQISQFDYFVAGFLVFNVILQMISVSGVTATEREQQTLNRIKMSYIQSWELFSGILLAQLIAYTVQFLVSVPILTLFGLKIPITAWLSIYLILFITTIIIVGISLIIASFVKDPNDAMTITGIGSAPLGFLSGSFLPVPEVWVIKSLKLQTWDFIPTYHSTQAITAILVEGEHLSDVLRPLIALLVYSIVFLLIGFKTYQVKLLKPDR